MIFTIHKMRICLNPRNPNLWNIFLQRILEFSICCDTEGPEQFVITQWRFAHLQGTEYKNKGNMVENNGLWWPFVLCLYIQKKIPQLASCVTGCIGDVGGVKPCLCWACVAGFRHLYFTHLTPSLSLSLLSSSSLSVNLPVTKALSLLIQKSGSTAR